MGFPLDQETITPLTDGVDYEEADNVNKLITKLANIISYLGVAGNAQAKLTALNRLFKYMINPLPKITWIDNDTIEITACSMLMHSGNNYVIKENTSALQIKLSVDLDTGTEAANTWYDVFLIGDGASSTYTAKFVLQGNTPSGATYYKKIFAVRNNVSSNILKFLHQDKCVMWDLNIEITTTPSGGAWSGATSCAAAIPAISKMGLFGAYHYNHANPSAGLWIRPNGASTGIDAGTGVYGGMGTSAPFTAGGNIISMTDASQQIQYYNIAGDGSDAIAIYCRGYYLDLQ